MERSSETGKENLANEEISAVKKTLSPSPSLTSRKTRILKLTQKARQYWRELSEDVEQLFRVRGGEKKCHHLIKIYFKLSAHC